VKELKTIDMYFGYEVSLPKNTNLTKTLNFTPIDGVSDIKVTLVRIVSEQTGNPTTYIWANGIPCKTPYIIAKVSGQYVADFECTNVINSSGIYYITIRSTGDLSNIHFRAWITYVNDPENQTEAMMNDLKLFFLASGEDPITRKICLDEHTLLIERVTEWNFQNKTYSITKNETIYCDYGCNENLQQCNFNPNIIFVFVFIIVFIIIFVAYKVLRMYGGWSWRTS